MVVEKADECPVCYEPLTGQAPSDVVTDNSLRCPNGHLICTTCVRRLSRPCAKQDTGFYFTCPVCREGASLSRLHMVVLMHDSWCRARQLFGNVEEIHAWLTARPNCAAKHPDQTPRPWPTPTSTTARASTA
jgi:hypothetical protein